MPANPLSAALDESLRRRANTTVLIDGSRAYSGSDLSDAVHDQERRFLTAGLARNSVVFVTGGRGCAYWIEVMALWRLGAVAVALDPAASPELVRHLSAAVLPVAISGESVLSDATLEAARGALASGADSRLGNACVVLSTSGTTGLPKAVPLSADALLGNALATIQATGLAHCRQLFAPVPFRFISGLSHFLATMLTDAVYHGTEERFVQQGLIDAFRTSGADAFGGSPVHARWLADATNIAPGWLMSSGDHLPVDVIERLKQAHPEIQIQTVYGLTELAGRYCVLAPSDLDAASGSVGAPIDGLNVTLEDGRVIADGPLVFDGYVGVDGERYGIDASGRFDTGDVGRLENGYLYLDGRSDDVFKSGGLKVSTQPIVEALLALERFEDVAVVAVDHPVLGQVPGVVYVIDGAEPMPKGEVMRALRKRLPSNHLPQHFVSVDQIQRTGSGKVVRSQVHEQIRRSMKQ